jgi:hypothetical protein
MIGVTLAGRVRIMKGMNREAKWRKVPLGKIGVILE